MSTRSSPVVLGLSHRTAPLAVREKLAVSPDALPAVGRAMAQAVGVGELVLVATCNRVEAYAAGTDAPAAAVLAALEKHFVERAGLPGGTLAPHLYRSSDREAMRHLFRVAASLDSMVVGEPQILGQVKDAVDAARGAGLLGHVLDPMFQKAFRVARRVRRETKIAERTTSVSSVAVELARQVFEGFENRRVLVIGAGKMSALAARAFRAHGAELVVTNRTPARAEDLAARVGASVVPFADLEKALAGSDIVLASTGAPEPIITPTLLARVRNVRRPRPLFLLDIAVPRDVDPACAKFDGVYVADIDGLQKVAAAHLDERRGEAERAEAIVEDALARAAQAEGVPDVVPTIAALRAHVLGLVGGEAERLLAHLRHLPERERAAITGAFEAVGKKLLHAPQVALRRGADEELPLGAAVRRLFGLADGERADAEEDDASVDEDAERKVAP